MWLDGLNIISVVTVTWAVGSGRRRYWTLDSKRMEADNEGQIIAKTCGRYFSICIYVMEEWGKISYRSKINGFSYNSDAEERWIGEFPASWWEKLMESIGVRSTDNPVSQGFCWESVWESRGGGGTEIHYSTDESGKWITLWTILAMLSVMTRGVCFYSLRISGKLFFVSLFFECVCVWYWMLWTWRIS